LEGSDLLIGVRDEATANATVHELDDVVRLQGWNNSYNRIETLRFANGTPVDIRSLAGSVLGGSGPDLLSGGTGNDWIAAGSGDDQVLAGAGNDVIIGGPGSDSLDGGSGNDVYAVGAGHGQDTIDDTGPVSDMDSVTFGSGIDVNDLWFRQVGSDLAVDVLGTDDGILVSGWYASEAAQMDRFETSDGSVLVSSQVQQLVNAMAAFEPDDFGSSPLADDLPDSVRTTISASWEQSGS
jgi:Ca2+-binding RTX toxin-like protein